MGGGGGGGGGPHAAPLSPPPLHLRIITHNIRYASASPFPGEAPWSTRAPLLCAQLHYHTFALPGSVLFLQEALHAQLLDIWATLQRRSAPTWTAYGVGRDDGAQAGEYAPILWDGGVWEGVRGSMETRWLNESGRVGERGWDAASVRIVTSVVLLHRGSGRRVLFMNTHLDDQGVVARRESARIIVAECRERRERFDVDAVVVGGDLNSETDGDAYPIVANYESSGVVDVRMLASGEGVYGEENTFTGFDGKGDGEQLKRIDFLFLGTKKENDSNVQSYAVLPNRFEDEVYLSDHRAVVANLVI